MVPLPEEGRGEARTSAEVEWTLTWLGHGASVRSQEIATMRSIRMRARSAISNGTSTSVRSPPRSFGGDRVLQRQPARQIGHEAEHGFAPGGQDRRRLAGTKSCTTAERDHVGLDSADQVYLDYTGGGLYAESQLLEHFELLRGGVFGNPHSPNPTSAASTELVERPRAHVLEFFRASPEEYVAIFTPNATGALRQVGEGYPFHHGDRFLLTFDNHNSVNGIREFARSHGAETTYVPSVAPELRVYERLLARYLTDTIGDHNNLFAYPAQSNFSGVQHPLEWIGQAQAHGWDVLLDAAAHVPTNRLDLGRWHPDFVAVSFYKMFGWRTGVGCLLARRDALAKLERPWFSGGTIVAAFVQRQWFQSPPGAAHFEDGTVADLNCRRSRSSCTSSSAGSCARITPRPALSARFRTCFRCSTPTGRAGQSSTVRADGSGAARRSRSTSFTPT